MKLIDQEQDEPHKQTIHERLHGDLLHTGESFNREIRLKELEKQERTDRKENESYGEEGHKNNEIQWFPVEWRILT
ncbi:MAG TPA: hypothetical protein VMT78_11000 [Terriglobia bacterium]|nr:hypothetical protein [Terriglobia bacterium]